MAKLAARLRAIEHAAWHIHPLRSLRSLESKRNSVVIGQGSVLIAGSILNPGNMIEEFVIINSAATVDHDGHVA